MFGLFKNKENYKINSNQFSQYFFEAVSQEIGSIEVNDISDIYALSFFIYNEDDDPRYPVLTLGYNTKTNYDSKKQKTSNLLEAKWNYAFWLQNQLRIINDKSDKLGRKLWNESLKKDDLLISDTEIIEYGDLVHKKSFIIKKKFIEVAVNVSKKLHEQGVIQDNFSQRIPIIIHELEYYNDIVEQTKAGNPDILLDEFIEFVDKGL